ncbi:MAG: hypothetical protein BZ138_06375, partial [Methanosphaera sp. rholeuAM270]
VRVVHARGVIRERHRVVARHMGLVDAVAVEVVGGYDVVAVLDDVVVVDIRERRPAERGRRMLEAGRRDGELGVGQAERVAIAEDLLGCRLVIRDGCEQRVFVRHVPFWGVDAAQRIAAVDMHRVGIQTRHVAYESGGCDVGGDGCRRVAVLDRDVLRHLQKPDEAAGAERAAARERDDADGFRAVHVRRAGQIVALDVLGQETAGIAVPDGHRTDPGGRCPRGDVTDEPAACRAVGVALVAAVDGDGCERVGHLDGVAKTPDISACRRRVREDVASMLRVVHPPPGVVEVHAAHEVLVARAHVGAALVDHGLVAACAADERRGGHVGLAERLVADRGVDQEQLVDVDGVEGGWVGVPVPRRAGVEVVGGVAREQSDALREFQVAVGMDVLVVGPAVDRHVDEAVVVAVEGERAHAVLVAAVHLEQVDGQEHLGVGVLRHRHVLDVPAVPVREAAAGIGNGGYGRGVDCDVDVVPERLDLGAALVVEALAALVHELPAFVLVVVHIVPHDVGLKAGSGDLAARELIGDGRVRVFEVQARRGSREVLEMAAVGDVGRVGAVCVLGDVVEQAVRGHMGHFL